MIVEYTADWVFLRNLSPKEKHIAVSILDANPLKKGYRLPRNVWSLREIYKAFPALQNDPDFIKEGVKLKKEQDDLLWHRSTPLHPTNVPHWSGLRPYQANDVEYLKKLPAAGIFNEPRTGKTPTAITLIKELGTKRNLIVCPASLIYNWANEFKTWFPECETFVYSGKQTERLLICDRYLGVVNEGKPAVLIVSKDTIKPLFLPKEKKKIRKVNVEKSVDFNLLTIIKFHTCFVDEAHFLRNETTAQSYAIYHIKADRRYCLSGTPTIKHGADIYGILHFLYPAKFNSYWHFVGRYFQLGKDWMGHNVVGNPRPERTKEMQEMLALMSTQRKRKEVMKWLPDKQRSTFAVKLDGKQQKLYEEMAKFFLASDGEVEVDTQNIITQLMRLRQLCLDPRLLGFETTGAKTEALLEYLESHREPIVIMSMFTSYLKLIKPEIEKLGLKVGFIHGEMGNNEKQRTAERFQRGEIDTLLCNIISAGTGFTLDRSGTVIFTDKAWNPAENDQAEDRVTPTTEERNHKHDIITFTCMGSVDARIDEVLAQKKSLTDYINEGGREALRNLMRG